MSSPLDVIKDCETSCISDWNEFVIHILYEGIYLCFYFNCSCWTLALYFVCLNKMCLCCVQCIYCIWVTYCCAVFWLIKLTSNKEITDTLEMLPSKNSSLKNISKPHWINWKKLDVFITFWKRDFLENLEISCVIQWEKHLPPSRYSFYAPKSCLLCQTHFKESVLIHCAYMVWQTHNVVHIFFSSTFLYMKGLHDLLGLYWSIILYVCLC